MVDLRAAYIRLRMAEIAYEEAGVELRVAQVEWRRAQAEATAFDWMEARAKTKGEELMKKWDNC